MQLQLSTWQEVESYLSRSRGVVIPIGSTEQHGPNGFVGTDALCPEVLARGLGEAAGALVAPTLSIGMAQHHLMARAVNQPYLFRLWANERRLSSETYRNQNTRVAPFGFDTP